jgi:hypothetical protein
MKESEWEDWCVTLAEEKQNAARAMLAKLDSFGEVGEIREIIRGELDQDVPELARFILLRRIWLDLIRSWSDSDGDLRSPSVERLVDQGAILSDVSNLAQTIAYETAFGLLSLLDIGQDAVMGDTPRWRIVEIDDGGRPTGRALSGLHESLLGADPTGNEGGDFLD